MCVCGGGGVVIVSIEEENTRFINVTIVIITLRQNKNRTKHSQGKETRHNTTKRKKAKMRKEASHMGGKCLPGTQGQPAEKGRPVRQEERRGPVCAKRH